MARRPKNKSFAVLGLGRFGGNLVAELHNLGAEVLAIDSNPEKAESFAQYATHTVAANATDERTLANLGIRNFDHVIVSFGEDIQSSVLTTLVLKEMGVKKVWVKAQNSYHQKVLDKIGADHIIHPERDMARRLAHHIISEKILDFIELSEEHSIVEIIATKKINGKSLLDLDIRAKYGCNIVAIKTSDKIKVSPMADEVITTGDVLIVIGSNKDINRFEKEGV
ncbi:potassium channel family protein [Pseudalkalibacillus caeni]|uniref:TrkA family potassium uptake protein n=1 Tax=Exobacillus caeni TaxID=2574798 RepID=A0A5R9F9K0_9BACL|nr:TrkA family potassium uptake protein [Pseudalkalibacillus caeni]TLS38318.1 TrkA family potassium uptake protein [Pseudalkalibacillus caeni]